MLLHLEVGHFEGLVFCGLRKAPSCNSHKNDGGIEAKVKFARAFCNSVSVIKDCVSLVRRLERVGVAYYDLEECIVSLFE